MRRASAILIVALALALTACAPKHATVADCITWMTKQLEARGTDTSAIGADIARQCESNKDSMSEAEFDRFLS
jgi:hypothetical protein